MKGIKRKAEKFFITYYLALAVSFLSPVRRETESERLTDFLNYKFKLFTIYWHLRLNANIASNLSQTQFFHIGLFILSFLTSIMIPLNFKKESLITYRSGKSLSAY